MKEIDELDKIGLMLYLCEGLKSEKRLVVTNSYVSVIRYWLKFLRGDLDISEDRIYGKIEVHEGVDVEQAQEYWKSKTNIKHWWKPRIRKLGKDKKSGRKKGKMPFGILRIQVLHSSKEWEEVMWAISIHLG